MAVTRTASLWEHMHPLTLQFREPFREEAYAAKTAAARRFPDMLWSFVSSLGTLIVMWKTRDRQQGISRRLVFILMRVYPGLVAWLSPPAMYGCKRGRTLKTMRVARAAIMFYICCRGRLRQADKGVPPALVIDSLSTAAVLPFGQMLSFRDHLLYDVTSVLLTLAVTVGPGGMCSQDPAGTARVYVAVFRKVMALALLPLHLTLPPQALVLLPASPACEPVAAGVLLLLGVLLPVPIVYCMELHGRSLTLRSAGIPVPAAGPLVGNYLLQGLGVVVMVLAAYVSTVARLAA